MRKGRISLGDKQLYYLQVFQGYFNHRRNANRMVVFSIISARIYESSGSHFLRTTTSMQSRLKVFYKSRLPMIFLTILGVTEILCTFIFVLEGKAGKDTSKSSTLEFLEKELGNNFAS